MGTHPIEQSSKLYVAQTGDQVEQHFGVSRQGPNCGCRLKPTLRKFLPRLMVGSQWRFQLEAESSSHGRGCSQDTDGKTISVLRLCVRSCGALLIGAVEASISITRGSGRLSISPSLQFSYVVPRNNPAFQLVNTAERPFELPCENASEWEAFLQTRLNAIRQLFCAGKASPYDVDLDGNTLLHVRIVIDLGPCHKY